MAQRKLSKSASQVSMELEKQIADKQKRLDEVNKKINEIKEKEAIVVHLLKDFVASKKKDIAALKFAVEFNHWLHRNCDPDGFQYYQESWIGEGRRSTEITYAIDEEKAYVVTEHLATVRTPAIPFSIEKEPDAFELLDEGIFDTELTTPSLEGMTSQDIQKHWKTQMKYCFQRYKLALEKEKEAEKLALEKEKEAEKLG
jgi:hypothetical protein